MAAGLQHAQMTGQCGYGPMTRRGGSHWCNLCRCCGAIMPASGTWRSTTMILLPLSARTARAGKLATPTHTSHLHLWAALPGWCMPKYWAKVEYAFALVPFVILRLPVLFLPLCGVVPSSCGTDQHRAAYENLCLSISAGASRVTEFACSAYPDVKTHSRVRVR